MSHLDVIRVWKDPEYRNTLSIEQLATIPEHPAGAVEIHGEQLRAIKGGDHPTILTTAITCTEYTWRGWKSCCLHPEG